MKRSALVLVAAATACSACFAGPDLIIGDIIQPTRWGQVGDIQAYSVGYAVCNIGNAPAAFVANTPAHPVFTHDLFRLHENRFEQIGMSWASHGFFALQQSLCSTCSPGSFGSALGAGCSDVSSASLQGQQAGIGPRSDINPVTGQFSFPTPLIGQSGDTIFKRMQVQTSDLLLPNSTLYVGMQVLAADEISTNFNGLSWRPAQIAQSLALSVTGQTRRQEPAIFAWAEANPDVVLAPIDVPGDGRFWLGSLAIDNGDGTWTYEYALHNITSHRAARAFSLPAHGSINNIGFHDIAYHSGEPFDSTDWPASIANGLVEWKTEAFESNVNANALRWGTLYNFRLTSTAAPTMGQVSIGLFRPGLPGDVSAMAMVPSAGTCPADFNHDGETDFFDVQAYLGAFALQDPAADLNNDGSFDFFDIQAFLQAFASGCP